jgi:hypothetical protein
MPPRDQRSFGDDERGVRAEDGASTRSPRSTWPAKYRLSKDYRRQQLFSQAHS